MKKFLVLILVLVMILTCMSSCRKDNGDKSNERPDIDIGDYSNAVTIYRVNEYQYSPTEMEIKNWESYMMTKYGISIELIYVCEPGPTDEFLPSSRHMLLSDFIASKNKKGFVLCDTSYFKYFIDAGLVEYVNDLIYEISHMKNIQSDILDSFKDSKGNIAAVPITDYATISTRVYNSEWLQSAGMKTPANVDEYREFAEYVAWEDPDGNGEDDTFIQEYYPTSPSHSFTDVFRAFGCYPDNYGVFGYNPNTGKVENIFLNDNFKEAMNFILHLKADGLIERGYSFGIGEKHDEGKDYKVASGLSSFRYPYYWEGYEKSYYMEGNNNKNLAYSQGGYAGFMVLKGTEDAIGMFEALSYISKSENGYLDLSYGIENYNYELHDGYINVVTSQDEIKRSMIGLYFSSFEDLKEFHLSGVKIIYDSDESILDMIDLRTNEDFWDRSPTEQIFKSGMVYIVPYAVDIKELRDLNASIRTETSETFYKIMNNTVSISSAVSMYKDMLEEKGILEKLEEINARLVSD